MTIHMVPSVYLLTVLINLSEWTAVHTHTQEGILGILSSYQGKAH